MLNVYWNSELCGTIKVDAKGKIRFEYATTWLTGKNSPISFSLPCKPGPHGPHVTKVFFENLLPESHAREILAFNQRLDPKNVAGFLGHYGEDCAGALVILPDGKEPDFSTGKYELCNSAIKAGLDKIAANQDGHLLYSSVEDAHFSIAGAQDKLPVFMYGDDLFLPSNPGSPTTHIIKPQSAFFKSLPRNEAFCMDLARSAGLPVPESGILAFEGHELFVVERFDRIQDGSNVQRIHQEDFCQALTIPVRQKYQEMGGPGFLRCCSVIEEYLADEVAVARQLLVSAMIFNLVIGNQDAHAKNFSIIHYEAPTMAPLYDLVSTEVYPDLARKASMSVGETYRVDRIGPHSFEKFATHMGVPPGYVRSIAEALIDKIENSANRLMDEHIQRYGADPVYSKLRKVLEENSIRYRKILSHEN